MHLSSDYFQQHQQKLQKSSLLQSIKDFSAKKTSVFQYFRCEIWYLEESATPECIVIWEAEWFMSKAIVLGIKWLWSLMLLGSEHSLPFPQEKVTLLCEEYVFTSGTDR